MGGVGAGGAGGGVRRCGCCPRDDEAGWLALACKSQVPTRHAACWRYAVSPPASACRNMVVT